MNREDFVVHYSYEEENGMNVSIDYNQFHVYYTFTQQTDQSERAFFAFVQKQVNEKLDSLCVSIVELGV